MAPDERLFQAVLAGAMRQAGLLPGTEAGLLQPGTGLADWLGLSPASADILYAKAHAMLLAGQCAEAARFFSAVLMLRPKERDSRLGLAMALAGQGLFQEAQPLLEPLVTDYPEDPVILVRCMEIQTRAGHRAAARRTLNLLKKVGGADLPPSLARLGRQLAGLLEH